MDLYGNQINVSLTLQEFFLLNVTNLTLDLTMISTPLELSMRNSSRIHLLLLHPKEVTLFCLKYTNKLGLIWAKLSILELSRAVWLVSGYIGNLANYMAQNS